MELKNRIKHIREIYNISQKQLANAINSTIDRVKNIENGRVKKLHPEEITVLSKEFNINPQWLLTGEGEMYNNKGGLNITEKLENAIEINYLPDIYAAAGYEAVNGDYPVVEKMQCSLEFVASILNIKNPYNGVDIIKVIGDSMEPFIHNGEVVVVERTHNAQNGDIVIANINGNVYVKRLEKDPFGKWIKLISENPEYETIKIEGEELEFVKIVGIVRAKVRPF